MGSKGSNTTTTSQNQTYAPAGAGYIQNALNTAQNAAQLPFNIPQAPVAGFSQDQNQAFQNVRNAQGQAQPYYNNASQLFNQSAQGPDISQFFNPYASAVTSQLNNVFGQQQSQNTGNLVQAAGGVGADRVAVGQSQLANQQGLAAGQTLAGLYAPSLTAAQQQQNIEQGAAYGQSALGSASQNSALSGANALLGTGGLQQQLSQAQLNAPYQQQLAQAAFPYQQSQFLSGAVGSLAPGLGGNTYGTGSTTSPAPSIWSQLLGLGTAGVGAAGAAGAFSPTSGANPWGSSPSYGGGNAWSGDAYGGSSANPAPGLTAADYGEGFARGGAHNPYASGGYVHPAYYDEGGGIPNDEPIDIAAHPFIPTGKIAPIQAQQPKLDLTPKTQSQGSGSSAVGDVAKIAQMAMMFANRGGRMNPYAEGGGVGDSIDISSPGEAPYSLGHTIAYERARQDSDEVSAGTRFSDSGTRIPGRQKARNDTYMQSLRKPRGYADGGQADDNDPSPASFDERFPYRMPDPKATEAWRKDAGDTTALAYAGDDGAGTAFPPPPGAHAKSRSAANVDGAAEDAAALPPNAATTEGRGNPYAATSDSAPAKEEKFVDSPWAALMAAGLGIAGGTSPFAAVNIGQGGMKGLAALQAQKEAGQKDTTIAQAAKRLEQEADFHRDQYTKMTPYQKATNDREEHRQKLEEMKPIMIGNDPIRGPIYARRDPATGGYIDVLTGKPAEVPPSLQTAPNYNVPGHSESEADPAALPPHARVTEGVNAPAGVNNEVLAKLPEQVANKLRAVDEGRISLTAIPLKQRDQFMNWLTTYDPSFDQTSWTLRNQQQRELSTSGNAGKMILAVNQLLPHLKTASDKASKLDNGDYPAANTIANWWATQTGDPRVGNFETVREVAAMDAARLLRGSGQMAEQDIEFWRHNLGSASSPKQLQEKIALLADDLMGARISSIQQSYRSNMRMEPPDFISKEAKEALETIKKRQQPEAPAGGAPATPAAAAPAPAPSAAAPVHVNSPQEASKLPKGTPIVLPDGRTGVVP